MEKGSNADKQTKQTHIYPLGCSGAQIQFANAGSMQCHVSQPCQMQKKHTRKHTGTQSEKSNNR